MLQQEISALQPGNRGTANIEITLTGSHFPTSFYAMFERWPDVADWALLVFAPILEVDHAAKVTINNTQDEALDVVKPGDSLVYSKTIVNEGTLALRLRMGHKPSWVSVQPDDSEFVLKPRQQRTIELAVNTQSLGLGKVSTLVSFEVEDDDYPDCTFSYELTTDIVFQVQGDLDLNQIDHVRPFGYAMATLACLSSLAWSLWTFFNSKHSVVLSSQPIFLYMMTFGTFVMSLSIFPLGVGTKWFWLHFVSMLTYMLLSLQSQMIQFPTLLVATSLAWHSHGCCRVASVSHFLLSLAKYGDCIRFSKPARAFKEFV